MAGSPERRAARTRVVGPGLAGAMCTALISVACTVAGAENPRASEAQRIIEALALQPGMVVADVGAGDGVWTVELARAVGPSGHVWATEVDEDDLETLDRNLDEASQAPYSVVLGDQNRIGLPQACCDAVLLRLVYHHFQKPAVMRRALARALSPGALLAVVDIVPQTDWRELPGVPDRGGHGITADELIAEMAEDGFSVVERIDEWPGEEDRYCVVFRRD